MNNEINMEDLNTYFEDPTYTPEEKQMLSDGFLEDKVYPGIVIERKSTLTTKLDKVTNQKMPMLLYIINFKVENNVEKPFTKSMVFYPKDHPLHWITVKNKDEFKKATGVDAPNAFADEHAFIGKEVDATLKKDGKFTAINFVEKGVIDNMKQHGQHIPDGKAERFDDDIPF